MDALDRISPALSLGERLVVRYRLPDGSATDVIGWLQSISEDRVRLGDSADGDVDLARPLVLAARRLPPARGGRDPMRIPAQELQRVALPGWVGEQEPMGEWVLRAAGGFTGRANSCLAVGDPGVPLAEAAARIVTFAANRGARPWAQVVTGSAEELALRELGWSEVYVASDVLVCRLATLLEGTAPHPAVTVTETLEPQWEQAYAHSRPSDDPAIVRRILTNGPPRAFGGVAGSSELVAIGRGHLSHDWLGVAAVWTAPQHRRRGWAGHVLVGLGHWAARRGARSVYLQVAADNEDARRAYERLGFRHHHGYRYLAAPGDGAGR